MRVRSALRPFRYLALLFCLLPLVAGAAPAGAAPSPGNGSPIYFATLGQPTQTLRGTSPTLDLFVPAPVHRIVGGSSQLEVVYSRSPLLDPRGSALSVYVNGVGVAGQAITVPPGRRATFVAAIPAELLHDNGFNHLQVGFTLRDATQQICGVDDPNLNVTVYGSSWFRYDTRSLPPGSFAPDLARLPQPFVATSTLQQPRLVAGLPLRPSPAALAAAGSVLARLGEDNPAVPPQVTVLPPAGFWQRLHAANALLVGTPSDLPLMQSLSAPPGLSLQGGAWRDSRGQRLPAGEGLIFEAASPVNPSAGVLVISGNGPEAIRRAATMLSSDRLRRLLHGAFALIPTAPRLPPGGQPVTGHVSLHDLGYGSTVLEGFDEHDARFSFDLGQIPLHGGTLDLQYAHSSTLVADLSSVRVDLNGSPVASQAFHGDDGPSLHWQVPLDPAQLRVGSNDLLVRFFLSAPGGQCKAPVPNSVWARVDDSTSLTLPQGQKEGGADLGVLPFPLVTGGSARDTVLVVPDRVDRQYDALQLAVLLGTQCHTDTPGLTVLAAGQATSGRLEGHTVLLDGLPGANPVLARVAPYLLLQASPALTLTGATQALNASVHEQGQVGIVEEFRSPWDGRASTVLVSATAPALLPGARRLLFGGHLSGTVATVDAQRRVQTFDTRLTPSGSGGSHQRPIQQLAALGVFLLLMLGAFTVVQRNRTEGNV